MYDYLVVGTGLSGAVVGRYLAEQKNAKVLMYEKRRHIAGNIYDYYDKNGIMVQKYGPHIFHTSIKRVEEYVKRWCPWNSFYLECSVYMNGKYTPSPFNFSTIDTFFSAKKAEMIKKHIALEYGSLDKATIVQMLNSTDAVVKEYAKFLYDNDYRLYTAKQWGISPDEIDISVLQRVPVLFSYKTGYFDDSFQAMPEGGFTKFVQKILKHPNITIKCGINAAEKLYIDKGKIYTEGHGAIPVVYTGPLDELFGYKYGKLTYRSLRFEWKTLGIDSYQKTPVVAYPQEPGYTRITEYKKLPPQQKKDKTTIALEYPLPVNDSEELEPYYPVPTDENKTQYLKYRRITDSLDNFYICGRLAEYKYYNMDQAIDRAFELCNMLENKKKLC